MNAPQQGFKERADAELKNAVLKIAIDRTTGNAERKRAVAVAAFPEFQAARARGRAIKDHVIAHLDHYLEMFERNATAAGATVHWASDDAEARAIITRI
ncbi:MAG: (Fe-S)-binding protein, partial [Kocuria rhizophila]